ncbi:hypothetical protein WOLCODRAFT_142492 [Wolfiporia cocos MD-104 SS10]|uniref:PPPDE domain-containing protein n=1 Tax=Wolfiporia cocos (strain MD-104) TaxID=742152 RepID=A0A2H3JNS2_WOLCO|nr:hypothetical protein WOLCODRAFT_142492 [Wolfiporia cocos MD-104 SS10]
MSVYTRGWFFDITSSLADDTAAYIAHSGAQPRVIFRARRVPGVYKESMQRYTAYRIGATTQPLWMMYEIGRRMASVMGYYTYLSKNCNLFATAFAHCLLHPGTLASIRDHGPVFIANDLVTLAEEDTLYAERLRRGEKRKVWAKNLGLDVIIRVCFIRYIEDHKRFGRSRFMRSLTPPQRSPWDSREYWWQDEIRAVRIFVILNVHRQDADSAEIVLTVASTMSLPTTHTLYVPNAENSRPDETITSTPGLELGRDEMLLLLIPGMTYQHIEQRARLTSTIRTRRPPPPPRPGAIHFYACDNTAVWSSLRARPQ